MTSEEAEETLWVHLEAARTHLAQAMAVRPSDGKPWPYAQLTECLFQMLGQAAAPIGKVVLARAQRRVSPVTLSQEEYNRFLAMERELKMTDPKRFDRF